MRNARNSATTNASLGRTVLRFSGLGENFVGMPESFSVIVLTRIIHGHNEAPKREGLSMMSSVISKAVKKKSLGALCIGMIGVLLSLFPGSGAAEEPALSGAVLLKYCEPALQEGAPRSFETGHCEGIVETLQYIQPLLDAKYGKARYCLPPDVAAEQEIGVVVRYLQSHPERLQEEGRTLALDALHEAFPCKP